MSVGPFPLCHDCGSPLQRDQRYCLACGERVGPRSPELVQLLRNLRDGYAADSEGPRAAELVPPAAAASAARASGLTLPAPRVSALLVLVFLGFGALLGGVTGSGVNDTLAASARRPLKLILPQGNPSVASTSTPVSPPSTPEASAPSTLASEPPASEPPAAGSKAPASSKAPAASGKAAPSSGSEGGSSGSEGGSSGSPAAGSPSKGSSSKLPPVKHVFVIALADEPYASLFGPASSAPYLSQTLERRGELLVRYYAVAHQGLADGIALLSGQGPTAEAAANCPTYADITPAAVGSDQQVTGSGCVYPRSTQTLAGQLTAKHLSWRAYVQGMDEAGSGSPACGHPVPGQADPTAAAQLPAGQTYATFRNPFVYFHSVTDSPACAADDVGLKGLSSDLANPAHTPSFSYIVPDRCHDGSPSPCAAGAPAGPPAADAFLKRIVPEILGSRAYKSGGLLVITVDQAPSTGVFADSSSCCGQPQFPNLPAPTALAGLPARGGGEVGALLLSPFVKPGTTNQEQFNHFSLLRTVEDLFALKHLGYAGRSGASSFGASVFSAYSG